MRFYSLPATIVLSAIPSFASLSVDLVPSVPSPQLVGTSIPWVATAHDTDPGTLDYRFSVGQIGELAAVRVDFGPPNTFLWNPSTHEAVYTVTVVARNQSTLQTATASAAYTIVSRISGNTPVISPTAQPLVALYSAPGCAAGSMYVVFSDGVSSNMTDLKRCTPGVSMNWYVAGMLASTKYYMHDVVTSGGTSKSGPTGVFTTGPLNTSLTFPVMTVPVPSNAHTATSQPVVLLDNFATVGSISSITFPTATNLRGDVIWYYAALSAQDQAGTYFIRPVAGGTMLLNALDTSMPGVVSQVFREIDLAGNIIRQTSVARVSEQMQDLGLLGITDFDHDAIRLPNGHTLLICSQEEVFPPGTQGSPGPIDILGNAIVDLDQNLQLAWSWGAYDHLDINRAAILGETCVNGAGGCPPVYLAPVAASWLHGNSLNYIPANGDILFSMRHQDWVAKIDYNNGAGTGNVLWELGAGGSFTFSSTDPSPWFSHQHDVEYELDGDQLLSVYDNGNTRVAFNPGVVENSRGMALNVDDTNMVVTAPVFQDLGVYSPAVGSAQRLNNGDYHFDSGYLVPSQHAEYSPAGAVTYSLFDSSIAYRSYRMVSLYRLDSPSN